jgi:hypothetical protein
LTDEFVMRSVQRTAIGFLGIAATLALHSLFIAVVVFGDIIIFESKQPDAVGSGANSGSPSGESGERRIVVLLTTDIAGEKPAMPDALLLDPAPSPPKTLQVTGLDALPVPRVRFDEIGEISEPTDAELLARAKLAGVYESQIRARILRAWTLPTDLSLAGKSCRVQIQQLPGGRIGEVAVELESCVGSVEWQKSVTDAIFMASPLPAPPHPSVFVDRFSLILRSTEAGNWKALGQSPL